MTKMLRIFNKLEEKEFQKFLVLAGIVTLSYYIKIITFVTEKVTFFYDEIVITQVSRLPLKELFDTIHAEPHPPGHYLFLKLLPTNNVLATLIIITTISSILAIYAFWLAYKTQIMQKYNLWLGLVFFACSFTFISITGDARQYSISVPVMLITLVLLLDYWSKEKVDQKTTKSTFIKINLLATFILFWGYIPYLSLIGFIGIFFLFSKNRTPYLVTLVIQGILMISYMASFGYSQMIENSTRFGWFEEYVPDLHYVIWSNFSGAIDHSIYATITIILASVGFGLFIIKKQKTGFEKVVLGTYILGMVVTLTSKVGVNTRYLTFFNLLLSIILGWGYLSLKDSRLKMASLTLIVSFCFVFGTLGSTQYRVHSSMVFKYLSRIITEQSQNELTTVVGGNLVPFLLKTNFIKNQNIIPFNVMTPEFVYLDKINRQIIKRSDTPIVKSNEYSMGWFEEAIIERGVTKRYILIPTFRGYKSAIENLKKELQILCSEQSDINENGTYEIVIYSNCAIPSQGKKKLFILK